jgi:DNA-binding CsgD family transcriptional regulator
VVTAISDRSPSRKRTSPEPAGSDILDGSTRLLVKVSRSNQLRLKTVLIDVFLMNKLSDLEFDVMERSNRRTGSADYHALSPREREVMLLAAKGFANKTIARELSVAEGTIKLHLHRVYQKLGIKSRFALAVLARKFPSKPTAKHGDPFDAA